MVTNAEAVCTKPGEWFCKFDRIRLGSVKGNLTSYAFLKEGGELLELFESCRLVLHPHTLHFYVQPSIDFFSGNTL